MKSTDVMFFEYKLLNGNEVEIIGCTDEIPKFYLKFLFFEVIVF